jgi:hypothetical protein
VLSPHYLLYRLEVLNYGVMMVDVGRRCLVDRYLFLNYRVALMNLHRWRSVIHLNYLRGFVDNRVGLWRIPD